jgi:pre-mRNA-splicing factor CWC26
MPSADLAAYLAKNYLTASNARGSSHDETTSPDFQDSGRPKKKRRKNKDSSTTGGLVIADDDEDLSLSRRTQAEGAGADDEDTPTFDTNVTSAEFRKKKGGSGWKVVATGTTTSGSTGEQRQKGGGEGGSRRDEGDAAEADRILAEAAEESRLRQQGIEDEDAPAIVEGVSDDTNAPRMQSGAKAGLQTAADTAALIRREELEAELDLERSKRKSQSKKSKRKDTPEPEEETIYRDATGRRIDVSLKRAEARAAEQEKVRAEKKAKEDAMGEVQRREREEKRKQLEEAKFLTLSRGVDDEVMNDELKGKLRWDDPMAAYMAQRRAEEEAEDSQKRTVSTRPGSTSAGGGRVQVRKKVYTGPPAAPNRYGILPGWRWDGVDRSNGFEKEWFQARSKKGRMEELSYQWQMDE